MTMGFYVRRFREPGREIIKKFVRVEIGRAKISYDIVNRVSQN